MPSFKPTELWDAGPHTLAKIEIIRQYMVRWFTIMGLNQKRRLLYIDGFAGPGEYTNSPEGSPIAALHAVNRALSSYPSLSANEFVFLFVEKERWAANHLKAKVGSLKLPSCVQWEVRQGTFEKEVGGVLQEIRSHKQRLAPTFAFIDPFGATGLPFRVIQEILTHSKCEVLLNLDSDGACRLFKTKNTTANEAHLDALLGGNEWRTSLNQHSNIRELSGQILTLYKQRLRSIPRVSYVFPFGMHDHIGKLSYHLVFASQHHLGLEKMKEAMEHVDRSGSYTFSDARSGHAELRFDFHHPDAFAERMLADLGGTPRAYAEFRDYALNNTPFLNPKSMLKVLAARGLVTVEWLGAPATQGFPEERIITIMLTPKKTIEPINLEMPLQLEDVPRRPRSGLQRK